MNVSIVVSAALLCVYQYRISVGREAVAFRADLLAGVINSTWQVNSRVTGSESCSVELNTKHSSSSSSEATLSPPLGSAEGIMLALSRSSALFRAALTQHLTPRANISAKPAKHVISTGVSTATQHTFNTHIRQIATVIKKQLMCL